MKKAVLIGMVLGLVLFLLPSCAAGVSLEEYVNSTYGYKISYPKSCKIDLTQAPKIITISMGESSSLGAVAIVVEDYEELGLVQYIKEPITQAQIENFLYLVADSIIRELKLQHSDLIILKNEMLSDHLRVLEVSFIDDGYEFTAFYHFRWHQYSLYKLYGQIMNNISDEDEIRSIIDSFKYIDSVN